ncbi:hypothetical protein SDC9_53505 [bioreactor metagenome]|uniref:DUF6089 domain-containing protein n=1 Tax=bioreactor metagenome TaxID=1076179 RepID=A0A644WTX4_9ZZZZ
MKRIFVTFLIALAGFSGFAQQHELGIMGGASYYIGDLNPYGHFMQSKPAGGLMYRYNINPRMAIGLHVLVGSLEAADSIIRYNEDRNLSFSSSLMELGVQYELSYYKFKIGNDKDFYTPYLFIGASFFKFNPQANYKGDWYNLQSLGTEGQGTTAYPERDPYNLAGFAIPFGLGFKISIGSSMVIGAEWGMRKTFTDYIDDVSMTYADPSVLISQNTAVSAALADPSKNSETEKTGFQRGNPSTKDWYSFAGLTFTFKIKDKSDSCPGGSRRRDSFKSKYLRILKNESGSMN